MKRFLLCLVLMCIPVSGFCADRVLVGSLKGYVEDEIFEILPRELNVYVDDNHVVYMETGKYSIMLSDEDREGYLKALHKAKGWAEIAHKNNIRAMKVLYGDPPTNPDNYLFSTFSCHSSGVYIALAIGAINDLSATVVFTESGIDGLINLLSSIDCAYEELMKAKKNAYLLN